MRWGRAAPGRGWRNRGRCITDTIAPGLGGFEHCSQLCYYINLAYSVEYFQVRVLAEVESWPANVVADYARIVELLMEHGPNLRLPHCRAFGDGLFELRPRGRSGIGRAFYCFPLAAE